MSDSKFLEISLVLPLDNDGDFDFETLDCVPMGTDCNIVDDDELVLQGSKPAIELIGSESRVNFFTDCTRPYLIIHVKSLNRFYTISFIVRDNIGKDRTFEISNRRTLVVVDKDLAQIPLQTPDHGWQRLFLDLPDMLYNAFGTNYVSCHEICIWGSCRVSKIYFQSKPYSDAELPHFLRVVDA